MSLTIIVKRKRCIVIIKYRRGRIGRIKGAVETLKELGFGNKEIEAKIMKSYNIDVEEASKYLQERSFYLLRFY